MHRQAARVSARVGAAAPAALLLLASRASAYAHGLVGRTDLPIPEWLFGWGATVVLVVLFVALGALWRRPLLERASWRALPARRGHVLTSPDYGGRDHHQLIRGWGEGVVAAGGGLSGRDGPPRTAPTRRAPCSRDTARGRSATGMAEGQSQAATDLRRTVV